MALCRSPKKKKANSNEWTNIFKQQYPLLYTRKIRDNEWDNYKNNKLKSKKEDTKIKITSNKSLESLGKQN